MELLIKNTHYVDRAFQLRRGNLLIDAGEITAISERDVRGIEFARVINGTEHLCLPGLINAHLHPSKEAYRGYASKASLPEVLSFIHSQNPRETLENQYWASLFSLKEALKKGTTGVGIFTSRYASDLLALKQIGLRGAIYYAVNERWDGRETAPAIMDRTGIWNALETFLSSPKPDKIRFGIATSSELSVSQMFLTKLHQFSVNRKASFSLHVAEGKSQSDQSRLMHGKTSIEYLNDSGILSENTLLIHSSWMNDAEISILKSSPTSVVYCPIANSFTGAGLFPLGRVSRSSKCKVGLGTDSGMINPPNAVADDIFHGFYSQNATAPENKVPLRDFMAMATRTNAEILRFGKVGVIEEGYKADINLFRLSEFRHRPMGDLDLALLRMLQLSRPTHVIVDGQVLVDNYRIQTVNESEVDANFNNVLSQTGECREGVKR